MAYIESSNSKSAFHLDLMHPCANYFLECFFSKIKFTTLYLLFPEFARSNESQKCRLKPCKIFWILDREQPNRAFFVHRQTQSSSVLIKEQLDITLAP